MLADEGYLVWRGAVPTDAAQAALRLVNLAIRRYGLTPEGIVDAERTGFFPHLGQHQLVWALLPGGAGPLLGEEPGDEWAEPQLLVRFPDEAGTPAHAAHLDEPPAWAGGRRYRGIVGIALTDAGEDDGVVCVWPGSHRVEGTGVDGFAAEDAVRVPMRAGDALVMHPSLRHAGAPNLGAGVRHAVAFRLLAHR